MSEIEWRGREGYSHLRRRRLSCDLLVIHEAENLTALWQKAERGSHPAEEGRQQRDAEGSQAEADEACRRDTLAAIYRYLERYAVKRMRPDHF
jgi:hypothetical protein